MQYNFGVFYRLIWHGYIPTGTPRRIHLNSMWILRRYVKHQFSTGFHVIPTYFFDVISLIKKSTSFPRTFYDVISMVQKLTLFPRVFFDVTSNGRKIHLAITYFFRCNFSCWNIHSGPTYFFWLNFEGQKSTLFARTFFDKIAINLTSFLATCKLMKTFEVVFLC